MEGVTVEVTEVCALEDISSILESLGKNINDYEIVTFNVNIDENERLQRMVVEETTNLDIEGGFSCAMSLNKEKQFAYDTIMEKVKTQSSGSFFIDGPGGTGKTFLYKVLLADVRSQNLIALTTASSGMAASLLPGGRTTHLSKQSALGNLLKMSWLIIWDEAPMINRYAVEAVDKMLRDITDCNMPFGGKVMVLGGDFRQVLSVVPRGK
ncbi:ATP-dependent DNA helicase PIF2-like [Olea europaea var. sylvestris]|uniref:ATP-dependent DNA helicase PIF2-like n=1 Tax=Olea europaea var. sylvestris TaxID=158386 RepID=UPI000C1D05C8|nr:ATP-dependent DNA helicase PIF2-like [Olea europaea var. sylvestris]